MEEDDNARTELSGNPQLSHLVFIKMEDLMDGLKLLNYETKFCKQFKFKPFPRYYSSLTVHSSRANAYNIGIILPFLLILENNFMLSQILQHG